MNKYFIILFGFALSLDFDPPFMEKYELDNGMSIVLCPINDQPMIYINTIVKAGDMHGGDNKEIVSELTEELLKFANQNFNSDELSKYVDQIGYLWTGNGYDYTMFGIEGLNENIEKLISLKSEILLYPKFNDKEFKLKKDRLLGWQKMRIDNDPTVQDVYHSHNMLFGIDINRFYSNNDVTIDDIKSFYKNNYYPKNMILMISGDFNVAYAKILIEKYFSNWKAGKNNKSTKKLVSKKSDGIQVRFIESPDLLKPSVRIVMPAVNGNNPDFYSFYSTFNILGRGFNSRIYNTINLIPANWEENYNSGFAFERTYNYMYYSYKSSYSQIDTVYKLLLGEFKKIKQNNITFNELDRVNKKIIGETILNNQLPSSWNWHVLSDLSCDIPIEEIPLFTDNIKSLTIEDINRIGEKYWDHENFYLIVYGNKDSTETFLNQFEHVEYYQDKILDY
tara:strand:- start:720 stop:2069 length:1350 start_codon:yes stop_codon:yes gene_type:complete